MDSNNSAWTLNNFDEMLKTVITYLKGHWSLRSLETGRMQLLWDESEVV